MSRFVESAGKRPRLITTFHGWAYEGFPTVAVNAAADAGAIPVLTWNPWDYREGVDQPTYSLRRIIRGRFDGYLRRFARDARAWGRPLFLRFAAEMNGDWLPWCEGVNGNRAGQYVKAWAACTPDLHEGRRNERCVGLEPERHLYGVDSASASLSW